MNNPMTQWSRRTRLILPLLGLLLFDAHAQQPSAATCKVEAINYKGWQAQQVSNAWIKLIFVPQNGGRLMQVVFDDHAFFFVNRKYAGKHLPPSNTEWFNYGGEKMWAYPDRHREEEQQRGNLDMLDYSEFGGE